MHNSLSEREQCLQVYGFIRILYRIICKNAKYGKSSEKEVVGSESDGSYWSSSAVLLILASNTEVYLPSSAQ